MTPDRQSRGTRGHKAVITGGAGLVGNNPHLARRMLRGGWSVSVIDDLSGGTRDAVPPGSRLVQDVSSEAVVDAIADMGPDVVIHAAARVRVPTSMSHPRADWSVNVVGTYNVVRGCCASNGPDCVFVSSGGQSTARPAVQDESFLPCPERALLRGTQICRRALCGDISGLRSDCQTCECLWTRSAHRVSKVRSSQPFRERHCREPRGRHPRYRRADGRELRARRGCRRRTGADGGVEA